LKVSNRHTDQLTDWCTQH